MLHRGRPQSPALRGCTRRLSPMIDFGRTLFSTRACPWRESSSTRSRNCSSGPPAMPIVIRLGSRDPTTLASVRARATSHPATKMRRVARIVKASRTRHRSPADAIRHWSAEGGHPIQDLAPRTASAGSEAITDDGLVAPLLERSQRGAPVSRRVHPPSSDPSGQRLQVAAHGRETARLARPWPAMGSIGLSRTSSSHAVSIGSAFNSRNFFRHADGTFGPRYESVNCSDRDRHSGGGSPRSRSIRW